MLISWVQYGLNVRDSDPLISKFVDTTKEQYSMWLLKKYGLPFIVLEPNAEGEKHKKRRLSGAFFGYSHVGPTCDMALWSWVKFLKLLSVPSLAPQGNCRTWDLPSGSKAFNPFSYYYLKRHLYQFSILIDMIMKLVIFQKNLHYQTLNGTFLLGNPSDSTFSANLQESNV